MSRFISRLAIAAATAVLVVSAAALAPVTPLAIAQTAIALPSSGPNSIVLQSDRPNSPPGVSNSDLGVGIMGGRDRGARIALPSSGPNSDLRVGVMGGANRAYASASRGGADRGPSLDVMT